MQKRNNVIPFPAIAANTQDDDCGEAIITVYVAADGFLVEGVAVDLSEEQRQHLTHALVHIMERL